MATDTLGRTIPVSEDGMALVVKIGDKTENCLNDVPLHPATNAPDENSQGFQTGDVVNVTHKYTFAGTNVTFAGGAAKAAEYRALVGKPQNIQLGDGFTGWGTVIVSEGPVLVANGKAVPTLTIAITWLTTINPADGTLVHPEGVTTA